VLSITILAVTCVSIRAPRAGGDLAAKVNLALALLFQSAPPVRGAIGQRIGLQSARRVSIRAPRAGGDRPQHADRHDQPVSIRAPRAGGDLGYR